MSRSRSISIHIRNVGGNKVQELVVHTNDIRVRSFMHSIIHAVAACSCPVPVGRNEKLHLNSLKLWKKYVNGYLFETESAMHVL